MEINRRRFLRTGGTLALGAGLAGIGGSIYGTRFETRMLDIESVRIPLDGLPAGLEGFRIVLLSDFHISEHTSLEFIEEVVSIASSFKADLVVLLGDFVLREVEAVFDLAPALAKINAKHGIFSILGNHDIWQGATTVVEAFERSGLKVLVNEGLTLSHHSERFFLAGVDDGWAGHPDLNAALTSRPSDVPVFLLAHEPDLADGFAADGRVALQLSGHSHGGQVRFPGFGSPFCPPLGRKYDQGLYRVKNTWLYTNRGIGVTVPIRLNCPPEITEVTLVRGD